MRNIFSITIIFLMISFPVFGEEVNLEKEVATILKLSRPSEEVADSALQFILDFSASKNGEAYERCEKAMSEQLIRWAEGHALNPSMMARLYDELGQEQMRQGKVKSEDIRKSFGEALKYAGKAEDYYREGRILEHYSLFESKYGDVAKGFDLTQKAINAYRKSNVNSDRHISRCYYYQAIIFLQLDDMDGLGNLIGEMESFTPKVAQLNRSYHLYNLYSVQEAYFGTLYETSKGKERERLAEKFNEVSLKTIHLLESSPEEFVGTSVNPVWNYYNRAVMFLNFYDHPQMDSLQYYLNKALAVDLSNKRDDDFEMRVSGARLLAEAWMKNGNYGKAKEIILSMADDLRGAKDLNSVIVDKIELYKDLVEIAREEGNYDDALQYSDSIRSLEHDRFMLERAQAVKDIEIKYQTKETELALAQSEKRRANTLMWLFATVGLLLAGIVIFTLYAGRQRRRRMSREIEFARIREDIGKEITRHYIEGLENERRRMSGELHDGICNELLAIQMRVNQGESLSETVRLIENCRESVRRISHELMPPEFDYASIDEVIRFMVMKQSDGLKGETAIEFEAEGDNWERLPDDVSLEVYRILQEGLGNAVKYSGATRIRVALSFVNDILKAEVSDNGTNRMSGRKGFGLESMHRRAKSINGEIYYSHLPDRGTKILLTVPITKKERKITDSRN